MNVSGLKPGRHRLEVVNRGISATAPLGLGYIYTRNSTPRKAEQGGKIIGAAVGGSPAALVLGVLAVIVIRRCRRGLCII